MAAHNLPPQPTTFIGRETEIAEIIGLLANPACRLLTLIGPGGIGKTRLALAVAERLLANDCTDNFADGIYFVSLQPLTAVENIFSAIASGVGFQFHSGSDPEEQLLDFFHEKNMLLLLDNFEHLLDGVALIESILAYAPDVQIFVTSREPLKLAREWRYKVRGMHFPQQTDGDFGQYDAVQLFTWRAQQVRHNFSLEKEQSGVLSVCQTVGGMPLALELTASWLSTLSPIEIANEIMQGLDILATDLRDVKARHRSIRAVFDTTWARLSGDEGDAFMKLSVFRGGCTREAAEQVTETGIRTLMALVDKSLLRVSSDGRYDLHELVRQYAAEKLDEQPELKGATLDRHCDFYARLIYARLKQIALDEQHAMFSEMDNLRLAWQWATNNSKFAAVQSMAESLHYLYLYQCWLQEGTEQFTRAADSLSMPEPQGPQGIAYSVVLCYQGVLLYHQGQSESGQQRIRQSETLLRQLDGPKDHLAGALSHKVFEQAELDKAEVLRCIEESNTLARESGTEWRIAFNLNTLGWVALMDGEFEEAEAYLQEACAIHRQAGSVWGLGRLAVFDGNLPAARQYLQEAVDLHRKVNMPFYMVYTLWELSLIHFLQGDYATAERLVQESYGLSQEIGQKVCIGSSLSLLSLLDWQQGHSGPARQKAEESLIVWRELNHSVNHREGIAGTLVILGFYATASGDIDEAKNHFSEALRVAHNNKPFFQEFIRRESIVGVANLIFHTGQPLRAIELLGLACSKTWLHGGRERRPLYEQLKQNLEIAVGSEAYATAWAYGQTLDLETTYNELLWEFSPEADSEVGTPNAALVEPLTDREQEVLHLLADGLSNREIAEELTVVVGTVKAHVYNICQKLGASNRTQAVAKARSLRLV